MLCRKLTCFERDHCPPVASLGNSPSRRCQKYNKSCFWTLIGGNMSRLLFFFQVSLVQVSSAVESGRSPGGRVEPVGGTDAQKDSEVRLQNEWRYLLLVA